MECTLTVPFIIFRTHWACCISILSGMADLHTAEELKDKEKVMCLLVKVVVLCKFARGLKIGAVRC